MAQPHVEYPELPERMTWEELEQLPEEIANQIELWDHTVVWMRRGPREHQRFSRRIINEIERCAQKRSSTQSDTCWEAELETNVFLGWTGKSDFLTPDFLVHRCLPPYADVRAADTVLVGEVLSPANTPHQREAKKARYAQAGIPWYWEVDLKPEISAIAAIRVFGLTPELTELPSGVHPLNPMNYVLANEWTPEADAEISFSHPFPINIGWTALEF